MHYAALPDVCPGLGAVEYRSPSSLAIRVHSYSLLLSAKSKEKGNGTFPVTSIFFVDTGLSIWFPKGLMPVFVWGNHWLRT
ncbi:hypothetical protein KLEPA_00087 (plasmid) [Klebsiella pneumoniae]